MGFKAGDRVKLTGSSWGGMLGRVVTVEGPAARDEGMFKFREEDGGAWYVYTGGSHLFEEWGGQLVEGTPGFEANVRRVLGNIGDMMVERNREYGNSALDPVGVFSSASREEQLKTQIDHKLSRVARGGDPSTDTVKDLIGYLTIFLVAKESE